MVFNGARQNLNRSTDVYFYSNNFSGWQDNMKICKTLDWLEKENAQ